MEFLMAIMVVIAIFMKAAMREEESRGESEASSPLLRTDSERATAREMMKSDTEDNDPNRNGWASVSRREQEGKGLSSADWQSMLKEGRSAVQAAGKKLAQAFDEADSGGRATKGISAAELRQSFAEAGEKKSRPSTVEVKERHEAHLDAEWEANEEKNRREREESAKRFATARKKQSNAEQLHTVHIDSCEGRLESLKVLYEAGILDREEYVMRVKRTKKLHRESGRA